MKLRPSILRRCIALAVAGAIVVGCATRTTDYAFDRPYAHSTLLLKEGTIEELRELLAYRTPEHDLFWSRARVRIRQQEVKGTMWFDATLIYRNPDAVRLRGSRVGIGTLFEVIVSGNNAWIHLNREKELFGGTLDDLRREGGVLGSFSLQDTMAAILVNHDLERRLGHGEWEVEREGADHLMLTQKQPNGRRLEWLVRRDDGLVRQVTLRDSRNRRELQITYDGYKLEGAEPLPTALTLSLYEDAMTIELEIDEYKLEPPMNPANVDFLPPIEVQPLRNLRQRESVIPVEETATE